MKCAALFAVVFLAAGCGDAGDDAPAEPDAGGGGEVDSGVATEGGALTGVVTRSAAPAAGGVGDLYIAVFTADPVADRDVAMAVANALVTGADMSADDASISYTVSGVPPRTEPYFVSAFLDDNGTASASDPSSAGPDRGDLVALDGLSSPQVVVDSETAVRFDLDLNFNLPF